MANRYKKFQLDQVLGSGQEIYDPNKPGFINTSYNFNFDPITKRIRENLSKNSGTIATRQYVPARVPVCTSFIYSDVNEKLMILGFDSANDRCVIEVMTATSISLNNKVDLDAGSDSPALLARFKTLYIAFYDNDATKQFSTSTDGVTWTDYTFAYELPIGYKIINNVFYIWNNTKIFSSTDGVTYVIFFDAGAIGQNIYGFDEKNGEIYALIGIYGHADLIKFDNSIQPEILKQINYYGKIKMFVFANQLFLIIQQPTIIDYVAIFIFDGDDLIPKSRLNKTGVANMMITDFDTDFMYIYIQDAVYKMDKDGNLFHFHSITKTFVDLCIFQGSVSIIESDSIAHSLFITQYNLLGADAGTKTLVFTTPAINENQIPAYLIIKHDPLPANATIVVKAKSDRAATFATTLLTNNTDNSVRQSVELKTTLSKVNFLEFEVTITNSLDASTANQVKNLQLIYLYTPTGLETAE